MYSPTNILDPNSANNFTGLDDLLADNCVLNSNSNNVDSLLILDQYSPTQAYDALNQNIKQSMHQQQQNLLSQSNQQQHQQYQANVTYRRVRPEPIK